MPVGGRSVSARQKQRDDELRHRDVALRQRAQTEKRRPANRFRSPALANRAAAKYGNPPEQLGTSRRRARAVSEKDTLEARLERTLNDSGGAAQVLNGGVGNYNAERYVSRFFKELTPLKPTDIVVHYFLRDAEELPAGGGNILLRHSELAVTLWIAYHRLLDKHGETSLVEHYRSVYDPSAPGFMVMQSKLRELAEYAQRNNIRIYLAMTPDVHNLVDYKFGFVHDIMRKIAEGDGYAYVDLLPAMLGHPPEQLWAMPGDPHPNGFGHELMANAIFPVLAGKSIATTAPAVQN